MILGPVANVFLFVDDLDEARAWYSARLGAEPEMIKPQLVMYRVGADTSLTLHLRDEYNATGPTGSVAYFTVDDVDSVVRDWTEHGATAHRGPKTIFSGERLCQLQDPFRNLLGVRQAPAIDDDRRSSDDGSPVSRPR